MSVQTTMTGTVTAVARCGAHRFSKDVAGEIALRTGLGVEGDAHAGATVRHRSRVAKDPTQPNLRQVHLIHHELIDGLIARAFAVYPGAMGENVTTRGIDLLALPRNTLLTFPSGAAIEVTGLRNPCLQLNRFQTGLMAAVLEKAPDGKLIPKAGIMAIVLRDGIVRAGDAIAVALPDGPHLPLEPV